MIHGGSVRLAAQPVTQERGRVQIWREITNIVELGIDQSSTIADYEFHRVSLKTL